MSVQTIDVLVMQNGKAMHNLEKVILFECLSIWKQPE